MLFEENVAEKVKNTNKDDWADSKKLQKLRQNASSQIYFWCFSPHTVRLFFFSLNNRGFVLMPSFLKIERAICNVAMLIKLSLRLVN